MKENNELLHPKRRRLCALVHIAVQVRMSSCPNARVPFYARKMHLPLSLCTNSCAMHISATDQAVGFRVQANATVYMRVQLHAYFSYVCYWSMHPFISMFLCCCFFFLFCFFAFISVFFFLMFCFSFCCRFLISIYFSSFIFVHLIFT